MADSVEFQEMILAAIASDFKLGTEPNNGAGLFGSRNGFLDVV